MNFITNFNLRQKIITIISIIIIIQILLSFSYLTFIQSPNQLRNAEQRIELIFNQEYNSLLDTVEKSKRALSFISKSVFVETLINNVSVESKTNLGNYFKEQGVLLDNIAQIRYLNSSGNEVVRVDRSIGGNIILKPETDLQNKGTKSYFTGAIGLQKGEIYISNINLNKEQGLVQISNGEVVPVIRYSTPVFANDNTLKGAIILNYYFAPEFDSLTKTIRNFYSYSNLAIVQSNTGDYLFNTFSENQWTADENIDSNNPKGMIFTEEIPLSSSNLLLDEYSNSISGNLIILKSLDIDFSSNSFKIVLMSITPVSLLTAEINNQIFDNIVLTVVIGILLVLFTVLFVDRVIINPLKNIAVIGESIADGDLTVIVDESIREDEIGMLKGSFSKMISFLRPIMIKITDTSQALAAAASEMASSSEEVNASSEEISSIAQQIAKGAQDQSTQVIDSTKLANDLRINFEEKIEDINQTSKLIEQISSQVNMLALNASIEAARAGEYGRGFAVVADNIRNLANDSNKSVTTVQENIEALKSSLSSSIDGIISSIDLVASVGEETAAGAEQASAATEEQAATMEELTANAQELSNLATSLENIVERFKV